MVSALNIAGHRVEPASQQFSTVPQFAREVGVALQACLKDHQTRVVGVSLHCQHEKQLCQGTNTGQYTSFLSSHVLL